LVISIKHHHLLSRAPSGLRSAIYQCFRPKAGDLLCNTDYATAQGAASDRNIYHMIAAKNRAHLCCGQHHYCREFTPERAHLPTSALRPVKRENQKPGFFGMHGFADLFDPCDRKTSPPGEADQVATTLHEHVFDAVSEPRRDRHRPARRAREEPPSYRTFKDLAAWS
jgi:hypothetical protein